MVRGFRRVTLFTLAPDSSVGKEADCNVGDLDWEDPLEKGKATHASILA